MNTMSDIALFNLLIFYVLTLIPCLKPAFTSMHLHS